MKQSLTEIKTTPQWKLDLYQSMHEGVRAGRKNLVPGLVIWAVATTLVVGYYKIPAMYEILEKVAAFKVHHGIYFSFISTSIFGGIFPFIVQRLNRKTRGQVPWNQLLFLVLFWGYKGIEIDTLYHIQAAVFGEGTELGRLSIKVFADQFIYCPFLGAPVLVLAYFWKDQIGKSPKTFRLPAGFWRKTFPAVLLSNWAVWIPTVALLYCLPVALQLPVQNLILMFFVLILSLLSGGEK